MKDTIKHYSNGTITIHWRPELCTHSAKCVSNLPTVFDVRRRPWIDASAAPTSEIIRVVEMCPSGALSWSNDTPDGK